MEIKPPRKKAGKQKQDVKKRGSIKGGETVRIKEGTRLLPLLAGPENMASICRRACARLAARLAFRLYDAATGNCSGKMTPALE